MCRFLEKEFLASVSNISDITRNFRILIAANQPTFQLFELHTIRRMRLGLLYASCCGLRDRQGLSQDIQLVAASAKKKSVLVENQSKSNIKYKTIIENLIKSINQKLQEIKGLYFI